MNGSEAPLAEERSKETLVEEAMDEQEREKP